MKISIKFCLILWISFLSTTAHAYTYMDFIKTNCFICGKPVAIAGPEDTYYSDSTYITIDNNLNTTGYEEVRKLTIKPTYLCNSCFLQYNAEIQNIVTKYYKSKRKLHAATRIKYEQEKKLQKIEDKKKLIKKLEQELLQLQ